MNSSLDALVKNLTSHPRLEQKYSDCELLKKKGIFPYEYLDGYDKLQETELPKHEAFYSSLKLESVTDQEFEHAVKVFNHHRCATIEDYLILYLRTDVLHLTDVFEEFRNTCLRHYGLDPLWFYTSPGLAWNAMLKKTKIKLELI